MASLIVYWSSMLSGSISDAHRSTMHQLLETNDVGVDPDATGHQAKSTSRADLTTPHLSNEFLPFYQRLIVLWDGFSTEFDNHPHPNALCCVCHWHRPEPRWQPLVDRSAGEGERSSVNVPASTDRFFLVGSFIYPIIFACTSLYFAFNRWQPGVGSRQFLGTAHSCY